MRLYMRLPGPFAASWRTRTRAERAAAHNRRQARHARNRAEQMRWWRAGARFIGYFKAREPRTAEESWQRTVANWEAHRPTREDPR